MSSRFKEKKYYTNNNEAVRTGGATFFWLANAAIFYYTILGTHTHNNKKQVNSTDICGSRALLATI